MPSLEYDGFEAISSELYDLDTEQSQARYDPRTLSREFLKQVKPNKFPDVDATATTDDNDPYADDKNSDGAYCMNDNKRYKHGEKVNDRMI